MERLTKFIQAQFDKMSQTEKLFRADIDPELLWSTYLGGFSNDPIFRSTEASVHNCNYCKNFIRRYGNVVAIEEGSLSIMSIFDVDGLDPETEKEYGNSMRALSTLIKGAKIKDAFVETLGYLQNPRTPYEIYPEKDQPYFVLGVARNTKRYRQEDVDRWPNSGIKVNDTCTFHHLFINVPEKFIDKSGRSAESIVSDKRTNYQLLKKAMETVNLDTYVLVSDLEAQGSLLNGVSYRNQITLLKELKKEYNDLKKETVDNWLWKKSYELGNRSRAINTAIGTLIIDLAEGMEINEACKSFNKKVDPVNYMKATAPITQKQIEEAQKFVVDNGYEESFERRCATIEDIKVNNILHVNNGKGEVKKVSVFDNIKPTHSQHKKAVFDNVEEMSIDKFMSDVLPNCSGVELYLENRLENNMVTLLTSKNNKGKNIFKWDNNFSWTYNGNLAGKSMIKKAVKTAGGFVDAPFRFSILWNEDGTDIVDFDAHLVEPDGSHIYYGNHNIQKNMSKISVVSTRCGGVIDIDMIRPTGVGVENIFYNDLKRLKDGIYQLYVNNYDGGRNKGLKAEVVFNDKVYQFSVDHEITRRKDAQIADLQIKNGELVSIYNTPYLVSSEGNTKEIYGLDTLKFHQVNLICLSPNYWQENGVGNKHYFFMLENAMAPDEIRTIHNEFLTPELLSHRKVMEVLGAKLKAESTQNQLSGVGFNSTVRDEVVLRLSGSHKRVIKVKF